MHGSVKVYEMETEISVHSIRADARHTSERKREKQKG